MMDRREFAKKLGYSAMSSAWAWGKRSGGPGNSTSLKAELAEGERPGARAPVWPRPVLVPLPKEVAGVSQPVVDLGGTWGLNTSAMGDFWANEVDPFGWAGIHIPGEIGALGADFARDNEVALKCRVQIPGDASGKRVLVRFDGVYSYARVWVNGKFVRDHHGGFTSWDCDITDCVDAGQPTWLTVGVTDRSDDISYASNYAKHYIGGILRSVRLVILPPDHIERLHVLTELDAAYRDARLTVMAQVAMPAGKEWKLHLRLVDPAGKSIPLNPAAISFSAEQAEASVEIPVPSPRKWDAEHPNLYTLGAELVVDGTAVEKAEKKIGFRQVERRQNRLLVNGDAVKLRGVCRHDTHPLLGRVTTPEQDERDVVLLREANVNFVRTSHYPPTESFLEACDRHGIYVEEESAVCFVQQAWSVTGGGTQDDPEFTSRYLNQFAEMIERDRSHPSVILWSLGNESAWGANFQKEHDYARQEDPSRHIIFSYPRSVPPGVDGYDIFSEHYPPFDGDLTSRDIPRLNDEYMHIPCYIHETLKLDPGVRNFWGHSLKRMWENCYASDGCLGGAIWAGFEEVFMQPRGPVGYGEWGIVDGWRRPKPEYWLTKKAYSPVRVAEGEISPPSGRALEIPIKNWFNHTNLGELKIIWAVGDAAGEVQGLNIAPGADGEILIPARDWQDGEFLKLKFFAPGGMLVDEFHLQVGKCTRSFPGERGPAPKIIDAPRLIVVQGATFSIAFDKSTGLISEGRFQGQKILQGGPFLNLGSVDLPPWWVTGIRHSATSDAAIVNLTGAYMDRQGDRDVVGVEFTIRIDGQGLMTTKYVIRGEPKGMSEVGVAYVLPAAVDRLTWERKAPWSAYPADHIGRPHGVAARASISPDESYRREPQGSWSQDTRDFFLYGRDDPGARGTNDFRSLKENIWFASCVLAGTEMRVRAESEGTAGARAEVMPGGEVRFNINNLWGYPDLGWGNFTLPVTVVSGYENVVRMRLTDSDGK